jgi:rfaE bifunctional protein kinase chain/domain
LTAFRRFDKEKGPSFTHHYDIKLRRKVKENLSNRLLFWAERFKDVPILVVGDLMVDRSCRGPADRISPEAPVPVVHIHEETFTPGGAGNVAANLSVLGARPALVSVCGRDKTGEDVKQELTYRGVDISGVLIDSDRPTITKTRVFAGHQQVARFDKEKRSPISKDILNQITQRLRVLIPHQKAVIISDYGKGMITPSIIKICIQQAHRTGIPVIVDPKTEHFMQYKGVDCITPNTKEAVEGMRVLPPKTEEEFSDLGNKILKRLRCESVLITRGEKGITLFQRSNNPQTIPALAQEVYDVTGAGDTVVAVFSLARSVKVPYREAAQLANVAASLVVAKVGTAVCSLSELKGRLRRFQRGRKD